MQQRGGWLEAFQVHPFQGGIYAISRKKSQIKKSQHQDPMTLMSPFKALKRGPWLTHGKAKVYIQIPSKSH